MPGMEPGFFHAELVFQPFEPTSMAKCPFFKRHEGHQVRGTTILYKPPQRFARVQGKQNRPGELGE